MKTIAAILVTAILCLTGGPANASTAHPNRWFRHHIHTLTSKVGTTTILTQVETRDLEFQGVCLTQHRTRQVTKFVIESPTLGEGVVTTTYGHWSAWFTFSGPHPCLA